MKKIHKSSVKPNKMQQSLKDKKDRKIKQKFIEMNNDEIKEVTSSENSFDDSSYCSHDLLDNIQIMRKQKQKKIDETNYYFPYTKR